MSKRKTIDAFFKKKDVSNSEIRTPVAVETNVNTSMPDEHPSKCPKLQFEEIDRDPGSRKQICEFPINKQDEIRRVYIKKGPYQPKHINYPYNDDTHHRRFQPSWFNSHKDWLEYSPSMDAIYCLPCYLFSKKPIGHPGSDAFISTEIGDAKFCILVDESRDESKREQMAIILRFVGEECFIKGRFFHIVHVKDTTALTLKNEICAVLSHYNLHIENIRGQGYDGASNMRGEWNGLQYLFLKDCPYVYYVHCMAHKLQLTLVTASKEVKDVYQFFDYLVNIINIVVASSKRNDELQHAQAGQIENMIASNEIETGRGANQIGTLHRAVDTRWGSHFQSICSLIKMFDATCKVINTISEEGANYKQRGDTEGAYQVLTSFEFILILHLKKEIMGITNVLCQALQQHSQDLLNAIHLVSTTKSLIQELKDDGWEPLLASVISFCEQHEIDIPDMNARYTKGRGKSNIYFLIDRLIRLGLTLPVSTATTEQAFSAMKLLKTRLRNRMEDEFLADNMIVYIEKEIAGNFTIEMIMDEFYSMKNRRQT
ncbi:hypothetical protein RGQ29_032748 [Quercus rubra]|uniref:TTF-type domain-containing protein n=1 Tax=Quercus rubra TaxID=3512 RepID=A0AAN7DUQ5_QUERU|nr:hypothetical protein RGQ29_032748 [Quercus rubra]